MRYKVKKIAPGDNKITLPNKSIIEDPVLDSIGCIKIQINVHETLTYGYYLVQYNYCVLKGLKIKKTDSGNIDKLMLLRKAVRFT